MKKFAALDGNSLLHRAYHALPVMTSGQGIPTNAVFGFLTMLFKLITDYQPDYIVAAFDTHAPTPRHIAYPEYKALRKPTDDELRAQFPVIKEVLNALGVAVAEKDGLEADDLLGIFSRRADAKGLFTYLVTGDKDSLQLVNQNVSVILTQKGLSEIKLVTPEVLMQDYALTPAQMIELKALMGDASDNIPGIKGVGEKTALKLLADYGNVENVLAHASEIKGKLGEKVAAGAESARLSRSLGTIVTEGETPIDIDDCEFDAKRLVGGVEVLKKYGLKSIVSKLYKLAAENGATEELLHEEIPKMSFNTAEITDEAGLNAMTDALRGADELAITAGEDVTFCDGKTLWVVRLAKDMLSEGLPPDTVLRKLYEICEGSAKLLLTDSKAMLHEACAYGEPEWSAAFDAGICAYVLQPQRNKYSLADLTSDFIGRSGFDAGALYELCVYLKEKLRINGMENLYYEIELPLTRVLFDMERRGFKVDSAALRELGGQYGAELDALTARIYDLAGEKFNINSPVQAGAILFEKLGLPSQKKTTRGYSTDAETLEIIADMHEIVPLLLDYRKLAKLKGTYIDGFEGLADADGRIHTLFKQTVTATGRISSTEPNLQNIPVRTEQGREIRKAFVAEDGSVLVDADYSQIELRVLAHMSGDVEMIKNFKTGEDIHARTALEVFGTSKKRAYAKAVNFGIVYGISEFGLARQLKISRAEAGEYIKKYLAKYGGIEKFMQSSIETAKKKGYAETLFGRRRDIPELLSPNYNVRSFGKRAAMNAPIQGTAADIIKLAMIKVSCTLKERGLKARLILQVHDELIVETPEKEVDEVKTLLKECMESVAVLDVPLIADVETGKSWYDAK